jgi:hypothetical protein
MKIRIFYIAAILIILIISCNQKARFEKRPILLADREAPLGWIYLRIYEDSTFEFISAGLRSKTVYPGHVYIKHDTLFFHYVDSIPKAGSIAIFNSNVVAYINGSYPERIEIKLNKIK